MGYQVFSDWEIKRRKDEAIKVIRRDFPMLLKGREEVNHYTFSMMNIDNVPDVGLDFLIWEGLERRVYWDIPDHLKRLSESGEKNYSEEELGRLTESVVFQIMRGENVASAVPIYSTVFKLAEVDTPISRFVSEDHKRTAINDGFWGVMKATQEDEEKNIKWYGRYCSSRQSGACKQLYELFGCEGFFDYFDFGKGALRASELTHDLNFGDFHNIDDYMRWYLVQGSVINRTLNGKSLLETKGRLIAPVVYDLFVTGGYEEQKMNKSLINSFVKGEIIESDPIQNVLGEVFELYLYNGLDEHISDSWSPEHLKTCGENLLDREKHVRNVWSRIDAGNGFDMKGLPNLDSCVREYIPVEVFEEYVNDKRKAMDEMRRFDVNSFREWVNDKDVKRLVPLGIVGSVRNKALNIYFTQMQRPSKDDLRSLSHVVGRGEIGSNYLGDKARGYLAMDFLRGSEWEHGNNIFHLYDNLGRHFGGRHATAGATKVFLEATASYVEKFGKVKLNKRGLDVGETYPKYNKIPDFINSNESKFEVV